MPDTPPQFASGDPPSRVAKLDFVPEVSTDAAQAAVASDVAAFMAAVVGDAEWGALEARAAESADAVRGPPSSSIAVVVVHH